MPHFVFLSAFVTNDNLVNLLGALLAFVALRYVITPSPWRMAWVGVVTGLLVTTKLSVLPLALVVVVLAYLAGGWRRSAGHLALGYASTAGVCGWYLIQNTVRYGDPLALRASEHYLAQVGGLGTPYGQPYHVSDPLALIFVHVPSQIVRTFWYQSDWGVFHWPLPVNLAFFVASALALAGLFGHRVSSRVLVTLTSIAVLGLASVWGFAFQSATYQARYALVGLSAMAVLAALGLERWRVVVRFLLPAMGLCGTLWAIQFNVLAVHWTT